MATATQLTVSDAADHVGVTRQTIFKAIKSGKLSATTNHKGHKQINVAELLRVYGELQSPTQVAQSRTTRNPQSQQTHATVALQLELERAKLQLERKDFELTQMRERLDELKSRERETTEERQRLFSILERQTLLLTAPKPIPVAKKKTAGKATPTPRSAPGNVVKSTATISKKPAVKTVKIKATRK